MILFRELIYVLCFQSTINFLNFLEVQNVDQIQEHVATVPEYLLPLPAVTMMIVSIRGVLLWAVNLSCLFYVIRAVRKMLRNELSKKKKKAVRPDFGYEREFNRASEQPQSSNNRNEVFIHLGIMQILKYCRLFNEIVLARNFNSHKWPSFRGITMPV